jgi:hypothetical protein
MLRRIALTLVLLFGTASAGCAAEAGVQGADRHLALAKEVLEVTNAKANMLRIIDLLLPLSLDQLRQAHPNLDQKFVEAFSGNFREEMVSESDTVIASIAEIYIKHFSEDDLGAILQFYKTPAGKRLLSETPMVMKESTQLGISWGREAGQRAAQHAIERMRKQGFKI